MIPNLNCFDHSSQGERERDKLIMYFLDGIKQKCVCIMKIYLDFNYLVLSLFSFFFQKDYVELNIVVFV